MDFITTLQRNLVLSGTGLVVCRQLGLRLWKSLEPWVGEDLKVYR